MTDFFSGIKKPLSTFWAHHHQINLIWCFYLGVPPELSAQRPAGWCEGLVQGGATLGGSENPDCSETQAQGGKTSGEFSLYMFNR